MKTHQSPPPTLNIDNFSISAGEAWCIIGANNSGIADFVELLTACTPRGSRLFQNSDVAVISFARQQEIFEEELRNDQTDFIDKIDPGTPARAFINNIDQLTELISAFNMHSCLDKGYRQLSSGEGRKLMLLGAISANPDVMIIENPYDGVDLAGCREIDTILCYLHQRGHQIIVTVNNSADIPEWCSHLAVIDKGSISHQGKRDEIFSGLQEISTSDALLDLRFTLQKEKVRKVDTPVELIHLRNGFARYGEALVFSDLNFTVNSGQHTLITGPNGSGKSTLLQMITGDNQNCYGNTLAIFGIPRGSGESIWQLKKHMGIVSPDLHRNYYIPGNALQVILSGFFDSIGVYRQCSRQQKNTALHWLDMIGLSQKTSTPFRQLSYAEQRLCLIARALIKMPRLLILDEPTQGLDELNRNNLLDFLNEIALNNLSTILYASHRNDEFKSFFKQHLELGDY